MNNNNNSNREYTYVNLTCHGLCGIPSHPRKLSKEFLRWLCNINCTGNLSLDLKSDRSYSHYDCPFCSGRHRHDESKDDHRNYCQWITREINKFAAVSASVSVSVNNNNIVNNRDADNDNGNVNHIIPPNVNNVVDNGNLNDNIQSNVRPVNRARKLPPGYANRRGFKMGLKEHKPRRKRKSPCKPEEKKNKQDNRYDDDDNNNNNHYTPSVQLLVGLGE